MGVPVILFKPINRWITLKHCFAYWPPVFMMEVAVIVCMGVCLFCLHLSNDFSNVILGKMTIPYLHVSLLCL